MYINEKVKVNSLLSYNLTLLVQSAVTESVSNCKVTQMISSQN